MNIIQVDLDKPHLAEAWLYLLDQYAQDAMGGNQALSEYARRHLVERLIERKDFVSFIAYLDHQPVGLINAFEGFSTFKAKPLLNIHDVVVLASFRGRGISQKLLSTLADYAKTRGCCKLTLEVLSNNEKAKRAYRQFGFCDYQLDPEAGSALFWEYPLDELQKT